MHASVIPSLWDIGGLFGYVFGNPWLFISSTTVMTTGLIIGTAIVTVLPQRTAILGRIAPTLALILAYFGIGSLLLSVEIVLRFHDSIPYETEVQLVSGIGHFVVAGIGLALLWPHLDARPGRVWLASHNVALGYWTFQLAVLTPPWFSFQGQREIVTTTALGMLTLAAAANAVLWVRARRTP